MLEKILGHANRDNSYTTDDGRIIMHEHDFGKAVGYKTVEDCHAFVKDLEAEGLIQHTERNFYITTEKFYR